MDPVAGIGLAASVIQLVTFSIDVAKTCREVYTRGSVSQHDTIDFTTGHLADLSKAVQQAMQSPITSSLALTREEKDLVDLARKCQDCANKLQSELHKLRTPAHASVTAAARTTIRVIWKKDTVSRLQEQLMRY